MDRPIARFFPAFVASAALAACAAPAAPGGPVPAEGEAQRGSLPPVPSARGPLRIDVVYPAEDAALTSRDSNFVFGSVGTGEAELRINGAAVEVAPNGAFLGYVAVPADGVYRVTASAGGENATATRRVRVPGGASTGGAGEIANVSPRATITAMAGELVTVRFRGPPGGRARVVFPDGSSAPLVETRGAERDEGFLQDRSTAREFTEYAGSFPARAALLSRDRQVLVPTLTESGRAGNAIVELVRGADTLRAPLELSLGVLAQGESRVGIAAGDRADSVVIGTAVPGGGTPYHWTFPVGTRFTITGEREGSYRVRLTDDQSLWVDARSVRLLPAGAPAATGTIGAVRVSPQAEWVDLRISMSDRLPARVNVEGNYLTVEVYGAESRTNWLYYGVEDRLVRRATWEQPRDDLYYVRMELTQPVWGWRTFYDASGALVVRVRRPPVIDARRPLAGIHVAVDAGHPPGGAIGPTRLTEAEVNLGISRRLTTMLREAGARVTETRPDTAAVALGARPLQAEQSGAHLLVSVHNNAFPDGVNPFTHNGTTAFYNAPQSLELARHFQRRIVGAVGIRDLGIAHADLALVRTTWMPSSLTESLFLMLPEQEAAARDPRVLERLARAHFLAIESFLRERAGGR